MFKDRKDAGQKLSKLLLKYRGQEVIVYGLTRGGVPVAFEIAFTLQAPLEAFIVKKIGAPYQEELALGAITEGDDPVLYLNRDILSHLQIPDSDLMWKIDTKRNEVFKLQQFLRPHRKILINNIATAIIVDDGIATGSTIRAAAEYFRKIGQKKIVVAVPVGQVSVLEELGKIVDDVVCFEPVNYMDAVGAFYENFAQVESVEVLSILQKNEKLLKNIH